MKPGMFVDPPSTLLRKPTAAPTVTVPECIAMAFTAARWKPGIVVEPDDVAVLSAMALIDEAGWVFGPKDSATPVVKPERCIAIAFTAAFWQAGTGVDHDGAIVRSAMRLIDREGWEIKPKERGDYERS